MQRVNLAQSLLRRHPYWVVIPLSLFLVLFQASSHALESVDEGLYAQIAKEMAAGGDWLTMHWTGQPWFGKPPLLIWLVAASYWIFGVSDIAARIVPSLFGAALIVLTFAVARRLANARTAWIAAAMLCSSPAFIKQAAFCTTDAVLAALLMGAVYVHLRWGARGFWAVSLCFALAYMDKSAAAPVAFVGLIPFVLHELWRERRQFWIRLASGIAIVFAVILPWHVVMFKWYGAAFLEQNLGYHVLKRVTDAVEGNGRGSGYYFWALSYYFTGHYVWLLLTPLVSAWIWVRSDFRRMALVAIPGLVMLALLTGMSTKLFWYLYPAVAPLAIVVAFSMDRIFASRPLPPVLALSALLLLGMAGSLRVTAFVAAVCVSAAAVFLFRASPVRTAAMAVGLFLLTFSSVRTLRTIGSRDPTAADTIAKLAEAAKRTAPDDTDPAFVVEGRSGMAWVYYTGRTWCAADDVPGFPAAYPQSEVDKCLEQHRTIHMIVPDRFLDAALADRRAAVVARGPGLTYLRLTTAPTAGGNQARLGAL